MDGVLLIDKPVGPTSHDVVARIRRTIRQRTIGHTGTLDPQASGLLPLVLGRATRLAPYLAKGQKTYESTVRLGFATGTDDAAGQPIGDRSAELPPESAVRAALRHFGGSFEQTPPGYSAKRIAGVRAYDLARRAEPVTLAPVMVSVFALECLEYQADLVRLRMTVSAGFYVRALARDLGNALGCGGHLVVLRRTASGNFTVTQAVGLGDAERLGTDLASHLISPAEALPDLPAARLTDAGLTRAVHGNTIGQEHLDTPGLPATQTSQSVKLLAPDGRLVALAEVRAKSLHPVLVLG